MTAQQDTRASAWSIRLSFELIANDQAAQAVAAGLTDEQLNWQPAQGSWSVGQCLEHLCITNEAYLTSRTQREAGFFGRADHSRMVRSLVYPQLC
jgi:hypothetical protein